MFRTANKFGLNHDKCIVGGKVNLTESSLFMSGEATKYCEVKCNKQHFTKLISDGVKSILFITGAASHTADPDFINNLNFAEYRKSINTPYLLYSLTFQLMDILIWFKSYVDQNQDVSLNRLQWISLNIVSKDSIWIKGEITRIADNGFGTFKPFDGGKTLTVIPAKIQEFILCTQQIVEVITKIDNSGKTLIENIRVL